MMLKGEKSNWPPKNLRWQYTNNGIIDAWSTADIFIHFNPFSTTYLGNAQIHIFINKNQILGLPLPKYISGLLNAVLDDALQLEWRPGHHLLLLLPLHRHRWHWCNICKFVFVLNSNQILLGYTYDVKLESLADYWEGWDLAVEVARVRRIREFQLQRICLVFIPSPQLQLRFYENKAIYEFSKHSSPIFTSHFHVCHA